MLFMNSFADIGRESSPSDLAGREGAVLGGELLVPCKRSPQLARRRLGFIDSLTLVNSTAAW
jgi:hypothetical protein